MTTQKLAVVLVRGFADRNVKVKDTLSMLRLNRKNTCVVVEHTPVHLGMLQKVKDFVTWGTLTPERYQELVKARGEEFKGPLADRREKYTFKSIVVNGKKYKPYFRLNPPVKGFGRKGIKVAFKAGGALGERGDKINDLIKRML